MEYFENEEHEQVDNKIIDVDILGWVEEINLGWIMWHELQVIDHLSIVLYLYGVVIEWVGILEEVGVDL